MFEQVASEKKEITERIDKRARTCAELITSDSFPFLGGAITHRMGTNLSMKLTSGVFASSGACFLAVTVTHLVAYYTSVLRPLYSDDPMLCPTCLQIRSFAIAAATPIAMETPMAVLANLSSVILNKTLRVPPFQINAYPEWYELFRRHAFRGMSTRYFFAYPLFNGFWASLIFTGQSYFWNHTLRPKLVCQEKQLATKIKAA